MLSLSKERTTYADRSPRNKILSIIPSETFHVEDGVELTEIERKEAEQMQRDEQLRRRDPKAHTLMILERKERDYRPFQHASAHSPSSADIVSSMASTSTQPVHRHGPMTATGVMLPPPSTAPNAATGNGSMIWAPSIADPIQPAIANIHQPQTESLPYFDSAKEENDFLLASERTSPRGPRSGVNGHNAEINGETNDNKENKRARKHSLAAGEERVSKKAKRAPVASLTSSEGMKKIFDDLLSREAARPSERGS